MSQLADQVGNKGYLAIIHVLKGAITRHEQYMGLCGYTSIDGKD